MYVKDFEITMAERMADVPSGPWDTLTENASLEYEANAEAPVYLRLLYTVIHDWNGNAAGSVLAGPPWMPRPGSARNPRPSSPGCATATLWPTWRWALWSVWCRMKPPPNAIP